MVGLAARPLAGERRAGRPPRRDTSALPLTLNSPWAWRWLQRASVRAHLSGLPSARGIRHGWGWGRGGGSSLDTLDICTPAACPPLAAGPCAVSSVSSSEKGEWHPRTVLCCADSGDTAQMLAKAARSH